LYKNQMSSAYVFSNYVLNKLVWIPLLAGNAWYFFFHGTHHILYRLLITAGCNEFDWWPPWNVWVVRQKGINGSCCCTDYRRAVIFSIMVPKKESVKSWFLSLFVRINAWK
jgi:hypothetical protein